MDVQKNIKVTEYFLFGKRIFKIVERRELNYREDVEPILPAVELILDERHNKN